MIRKIRFWLLQKIAGSDAVAINLHLKNTGGIFIPYGQKLLADNVTIVAAAVAFEHEARDAIMAPNEADGRWTRVRQKPSLKWFGTKH